MKLLKIIALIISSTFAVKANAQQYKWSAGYQLCAGNSNIPNSFLTGEQNIDMKPLLTNQLFLKRKLARKLDIELGIGITAWKTTFENAIYTNPITFETYKHKNTALNVTLTAKYSVIQRNMFNLYIPFGINNTYYRTKTNYEGTSPSYGWFEYQNREIQFGQNIFTGLGLNFDLNKRIYLNGQGIIGYKLYNALQDFDKASNNSSNVSYGFQAGIGCRF